MRLFITDKPSLARAIADSLPGPIVRDEGFIQVGADAVTWSYGAVVELAPDKDVGVEHGFITPRVVWRGETKAQLRVVMALLDRATEVIHAGPPGCEGQMWIDDLLRFVRWQGPTLRLLMHATEPNAMKAAQSQLIPNAAFADLADAARFRLEADWLFEKNLSPAVSKRLATDQPTQIGRLEMPTLATIVRRDEEVENLTVRWYPNNELTLGSERGRLALTLDQFACEFGLWDSREAEVLHEKLAQLDFVTVTVKKEIKCEPPPKPFALATFQTEACARFGWTAAKSIALAQSLYDTKNQLASFPKTNCEFLPPAQAADAIGIARHIVEHRPFAAFKPLLALVTPQASVYDASQVTSYGPSDLFEHQALVPTVKPADLRRLTPDEQNAWLLLAERFLMSVLPAHKIALTTVSVSLTGDGRIGDTLSAMGEVSLNMAKSWRALDPQTYRALPNIEDGTTLKCLGCRVVLQQSASPRHFTEKTLIETMTIGTAETQTWVIESLMQRGFIVSREGALVSTPLGRAILELLPNNLTSIASVGKWDERLQLLETDGVARELMEAWKQELKEEISLAVDFVRQLPAGGANRNQRREVVS